MQSDESAAMDFEREKWQTEVDLRKRELELKERDQRNRDAEVEIRRKEQVSSAWRSPLTVAVFATALAAAGNAVVTVVNGSLQRELDSRKRESEISLERSKAESSRILEMIKTGDTEKAAGNLEFLLKSGLVIDPVLTAKLSDFLKQRTPGSGPSLPSPTTRVGFEQSDSLTQTLQENLQRLLNSYFAYLDQIGFPPAKTKVTVKVQTSESANAYYLDDAIVIDPRLADDPSVPLREYNHFILTLNKQKKEWMGNYAAIESGLADYFACSFLNNPNLGEKAIKAIDAKRQYIRTLSNNRSFKELLRIKNVSEFPYLGAEVWGGAFWKIREKLGRDVADSMIASAWLNLKMPSEDAQLAPEFVRALLAQAKARSQTSVDSIEGILRERSFPIQP